MFPFRPFASGSLVQNLDGDLLLDGGSPPTPSGPVIRTPRELSSGSELRPLLLQVHELRVQVEDELRAVPGEFQHAFRKTTLRLRAWPRRKGEPPYALYWITFPPKKEYYDDWMQRVIDKQTPQPRWFHRVKIRTSRDMDRAIHRAGLDFARREVHAFHRRARSLNDAHKILTGTLDGIRKMLESKAGGKGSSPPQSQPLPDGLPQDLTLALELIRRLVLTIRRRQDDCRLLVRWARRKPHWQSYRLSFPDDAAHTYGRFLWVDDETGRSYGQLNYRQRRKLCLPSRVSRVIGPFEVQRRVLDRQLKASTSLIRRIKARIPVALRQARACVEAARAEPTPRMDSPPLIWREH